MYKWNKQRVSVPVLEQAVLYTVLDIVLDIGIVHIHMGYIVVGMGLLNNIIFKINIRLGKASSICDRYCPFE